ncbi:MAG TPA: alkaline phosphatase family protein [Polyangia bacterium]|nr:alkaline phosphatase family protein [Polyangia bacterium]
MRWLACAFLLTACGDDTSGHPPPQPGPHVIFIDIDDHGLAALWDSSSPNLQRMAREGAFAYSRVDLPTHSNQSNLTLLTGAWPEVTDVPHNSWLDRMRGYQQPFNIGAVSAGSYIYYDQNPLAGRVQSIYTAAHAAGLRSTYVGLLPPFERGADEVHFTVYQAKLFGLLTITQQVAQAILMQLHYPPDVVAGFKLDGPPMDGEALNQFTLRDAAKLFQQAAMGGPPPPHFLFVWDFVALDGDPTSTDGGSGPAVKKIVEDIDAGIGQLMAAVRAAGYEDRTSYVVTLDHGKVDATNQVAFEEQLKPLAAARSLVEGTDYKTLNEDGDVLVYAMTSGAGTPAGATRQMQIAHTLGDIVQSGMLMGVDTTRTVTWDGYLGTRRFYDLKSSGPNNPDLIAFPLDAWTLNDVAGNKMPGPIGRPNPFGRHGGFSIDELYVPAIFYGPAFQKGILLPTPIDHADIAPTVAVALGAKPPETAQGGPLLAVLAGDMSHSETLPFPTDPHPTRDAVLAKAGYTGAAPHLSPGPPAEGVVLIDVSGLYEDAFPSGGNVSALVQAGVRFTGMHTRFRDWPVTEYQMLTGTYPLGASAAYVPFAEDDPMLQAPPGQGEFAMPPAPNHISDMAGYMGWHQGADKYQDQTVFEAAKAMGLRTAVLGAPDAHLAHIRPTGLDVAGGSTTIDQFLAGLPASKRAFIVLAVDGGANPAAAADDAVGMVKQALTAVGLKDSYVIALTSRGGAPIDSPTADAQGPGSARHVPLVMAGPNLRAGVVVGGPATPADLAPTLLFALGAAARGPDLAFGVQLDGGTTTGPMPVPLPLPHGDRDGRVLLQAFMP